MEATHSISKQIEVRPFDAADLAAAAEIHLAAFPRSALTALGQEAVRRYYKWQLIGPHEAAALALQQEAVLAGFCFGGVFRGAMSGFLQQNRAFLAWRVLTHPWLIANPLFRQRLSAGLHLLRRLAGKQSTSPSAQPKRSSFGILAIAVHPKFQGHGIGRLLMEHAEAIAQERGFTQMNLHVNTDNQPAIAFYESLGWQKVAGPDAWEGNMIKTLAQAVKQ